ncbi:MAG: FAD-dependent oxidoreductase [Ferrimonas sp.]
MINTQSVDVAIVGGGMVGLSAALGLAQAGYQVAVIEPHPVTEAVEAPPSVRVSAINEASQHWLQQLSVWPQLPKHRLSPYRAMQVWDRDNIGHIGFAADPHPAFVNGQQLGHIVENDQLCFALQQQASQQHNIQLITTRPQAVAISERDAWLTLENNQMLSAALLIAADGAHSWLRQQCQIPLVFKDYDHHAQVATVHCQHPHQQIARQIFMSDGPLALLPLADPHLCSIVWSQSPTQSQLRQQLDDDLFGLALSVASESCLGRLTVQSERHCFPLTMRYAQDFVRPRLALIGDAAHTIHPLAGQGVNLGFGDAKALVDLLSQAKGSLWDIGAIRLLQRYERQRQAAAQEMIIAMAGFHWLFQGDHPLKKAVRGLGLHWVNRCTPLKRRFLEHAMGRT